MSGTTTGLPAGFGGFATDPNGELTYLNRRFNPYAFLQQDQSGMMMTPSGLAAAAPAQGQFASGGLAGMTPEQHANWTRLLNLRRGGRVMRQRFDDGGDAGGDGGDSGSQGATGDAGAGATGTNNSMGIGDDGNAIGLGADGNPAATMGGMTSAGTPSALGFPGFAPSTETAPTLGQLGMAGATAGVGGLAPGLGAVMGMSGLSSAAASAMGVGAMGPGATMGSHAGASVGSALGGPAGAAVGAMVGAEAGAHGSSGLGMGGNGSNAGPGGSTGYDAGQPNGQPTPPGAGQEDISSLIQRIRAAMGNGAQTGATPPAQGFAAGGSAMGSPGPMHFHGGSGLVQGATDGRADKIKTSVPHGSYIVPADVVSGLGQGNTLAGAHKLGSMLRPAMHFASGGSVPVRLSGGEFVLHPAHVAALGGGNLKAGSDKLDQMVGHVRRISAAQVSRMPPPR